jgi:hypothetical protein
MRAGLLTTDRHEADRHQRQEMAAPGQKRVSAKVCFAAGRITDTR